MLSLLEKIKNFDDNYLTVYDIEKLLFGGENINQKDDEGNTLLIYAINYANNDCVKLLLNFGLDSNETNNDGISPLFFAVKKGNEKILQTLLEYNIEDKYIDEVLSYIIEKNKLNMLNILMDYISNVPK